jgi:hypothetical protein
MNGSRIRTRLEIWAGLWFAGLVWAANMQIGQILPSQDCTREIRISALVSLALTIFALIAGLISWRSARTPPAGFASPDTIRFDATVSALSALLFAFALALQTLASLVLTGCER